MKKFFKYLFLIILLFVIVMFTKTSQIFIEKHYAVATSEIVVKQFEGDSNYFLMLNAISQEKKIVQALVSLGCFILFILTLVLIVSLIVKDTRTN